MAHFFQQRGKGSCSAPLTKRAAALNAEAGEGGIVKLTPDANGARNLMTLILAAKSLLNNGLPRKSREKAAEHAACFAKSSRKPAFIHDATAGSCFGSDQLAQFPDLKAAIKCLKQEACSLVDQKVLKECLSWTAAETQLEKQSLLTALVQPVARIWCVVEGMTDQIVRGKGFTWPIGSRAPRVSFGRKSKMSQQPWGQRLGWHR